MDNQGLRVLLGRACAANLLVKLDIVPKEWEDDNWTQIVALQRKLLGWYRCLNRRLASEYDGVWIEPYPISAGALGTASMDAARVTLDVLVPCLAFLGVCSAIKMKMDPGYVGTVPNVGACYRTPDIPSATMATDMGVVLETVPHVMTFALREGPRPSQKKKTRGALRRRCIGRYRALSTAASLTR